MYICVGNIYVENVYIYIRRIRHVYIYKIHMTYMVDKMCILYMKYICCICILYQIYIYIYIFTRCVCIHINISDINKVYYIYTSNIGKICARLCVCKYQIHIRKNYLSYIQDIIYVYKYIYIYILIYKIFVGYI